MVDDSPTNDLPIAARFNHRASTPKNELYSLAGEALSLVPFQLREQVLQHLQAEDIYGISCNTIFQIDVSDEQRHSFDKLWEKAVNFTCTLGAQLPLNIISHDEQPQMQNGGGRWHDPFSSRLPFKRISQLLSSVHVTD